MYWPRAKSMYVNSGSGRNAVAHAGQTLRWKLPSRIASRRSGRRSPLMLITRSKRTGVLHAGQLSS
jgi:hypothetical protein